MKKAWVVSVDMGYGHQRAAYPLKDIAFERIITINSSKLLTKKEVSLWRQSQGLYEGVSRLTSIPMIGRFIFNLYDRSQAIADFYPFRDLSTPSFQAIYLYHLIHDKGLNKSLIRHIKRYKLPLIATFFMPALIADYNGLKDVYCVVTDTDLNRAWIPIKPKHSNITYLASCEHAVKRLKQYGIPNERIIFTGFPLPKENVGGPGLQVLKKDLGYRMPNLDPNKKYAKTYEPLIKDKLGKYYKRKSNHKLTIMLAIGGAGAQKEIPCKMIESLKQKIIEGKIRINIGVGTRTEVSEFFMSFIEKIGLGEHIGKEINLIFAWNKAEYFQKFNQALHTTDILWTKPSELSFYVALGIPIIIAPPIGAHEYYNQKWLVQMGSGIPQENPSYTNEWLTDLLESGQLAEAAFQGFIEAPKLGTYNIEKAVFGRHQHK